MTVKRFPQDCQNQQNLRAEALPADTPVREKLRGLLAYSSRLYNLSEQPEFLFEQTTKTKIRFTLIHL